MKKYYHQSLTFCEEQNMIAFTLNFIIGTKQQRIFPTWRFLKALAHYHTRCASNCRRLGGIVMSIFLNLVLRNRCRLIYAVMSISFLLNTKFVMLSTRKKLSVDIIA